MYFQNPKSPLLSTYKPRKRLQLTRGDNGGLLLVVDGTASGTGSLKSLDNVERVLVSDLAEDDVAAVEPRGNNGGDEELRTVAVKWPISDMMRVRMPWRVAYVLGPALAMDSRPGRSCFSWKFSSANFSP